MKWFDTDKIAQDLVNKLVDGIDITALVENNFLIICILAIIFLEVFISVLEMINDRLGRFFGRIVDLFKYIGRKIDE